MADDEPDPAALERRAGLPDALRVLLEAYPRAGWESHRQFDGLVRFWLERHMMFRRLVEHLQQEAEARIDGHLSPDRHLAGVARFGGLLVQELHGHHMIEDHHYFPVLERRDLRLAYGFALLDADHHALDAELGAFTAAANAALQAGKDSRTDSARDAVGRYLEALARLDRLLDRHLVDEEELVVPVILKYGTAGLP